MLLVSFVAKAEVEVPKFTHQYVNDYGDLLSPSEDQSINQMLKAYQDSTSNQLVVLTLTSFDDQNDGPLFDFSKKVFTSWGIGQKSKNNGVLLVVVKTLASKRAPGLRIVTGYGAEGPLPDLICKRIIESIRPAINEGNYYQGINSAVNQMVVHLKGEFKADGKPKPEDLPTWIIILIIFIVIAFAVMIMHALRSIGHINDDDNDLSDNFNHSGSNDEEDYNKSRRSRDNSDIFIASALITDSKSENDSINSYNVESEPELESENESDTDCDCGGGDSGGGGAGD